MVTNSVVIQGTSSSNASMYLVSKHQNSNSSTHSTKQQGNVVCKTHKFDMFQLWSLWAHVSLTGTVPLRALSANFVTRKDIGRWSADRNRTHCPNRVPFQVINPLVGQKRRNLTGSLSLLLAWYLWSQVSGVGVRMQSSLLQSSPWFPGTWANLSLREFHFMTRRETFSHLWQKQILVVTLSIVSSAVQHWPSFGPT